MNTCKIGDLGQGVCPCHDDPETYITTFSIGAKTVFVNGENVMIVGGIGISSCGHPTIALTGSNNVFAENQGIHRVGDEGNNCGMYTALTGSNNTFTN